MLTIPGIERLSWEMSSNITHQRSTSLKCPSLSGADWLGLGYQIWGHCQFAYKSDYLVMAPDFYWSGVRHRAKVASHPVILILQV